jgi:hypothetical protein
MFSDHVDEIKGAVGSFLSASDNQPIPGKGEENSIVDRIRKDAELYCSESEVIDRISKLPELFGVIHPRGDLAMLYDITTTEVQDVPPGSASIGQWLDQNKDVRGYFFQVTREHRPVTVRVPKDPMRRITGFNVLYGTSGDDDYKYVTESREFISGYASTVKLPFSYIRLSGEPKFPNINPSAAFIAPIVSMTHLRLFWAFALYDYADWKERKRIGKLEWATDEVTLRNNGGIRELVEAIGAKFLSFMESPIRAKWGEPEEPAKLPTTGASPKE